MNKASFVALSGAVVLALGLASAVGCKKDEPPPPLPEPPKATETTAEAPLQLEPEDAGPPVQEKATPKPSGTGAKSSGTITQCCAALRQNAASAPAPTNQYMLYAASACDAAAAVGKDKASVIGQIQTALKGAGLPAACK